MLERRAHARGLMAWIDGDERHQGGPREVLGGALRGPDGIALLGGLEDPGVVGLDEPDVMRELTAVLQVEEPVALGVVPEPLHAPDQPGGEVVFYGVPELSFSPIMQQAFDAEMVIFDPTQGWQAYPDFAERFAKLWGAAS